MRKNFYVIARGKKKGIFDSWSECEYLVAGVRGAKYKGFYNLDDAVDYIVAEIDDGVGYIIDLGGKREWYRTYHEFMDALQKI